MSTPYTLPVNSKHIYYTKQSRIVQAPVGCILQKYYTHFLYFYLIYFYNYIERQFS